MGNLLLETGQEAEDLGNGADSMKKASDHATEIVHQLRVISDEVHQAVETIAQQTKQTNASAQKIREASRFISEIAEETNLLALNASIEAARLAMPVKGLPLWRLRFRSWQSRRIVPAAILKRYVRLC